MMYTCKLLGNWGERYEYQVPDPPPVFNIMGDKLRRFIRDRIDNNIVYYVEEYPSSESIEDKQKRVLNDMRTYKLYEGR